MSYEWLWWKVVGHGCKADGRIWSLLCIWWWVGQIIYIFSIIYMCSPVSLPLSLSHLSLFCSQISCLLYCPVWVHLFSDALLSFPIFLFDFVALFLLLSDHNFCSLHGPPLFFFFFTLTFSGSCRGAVFRFMTNTAGTTRRPRGCCWSSIRSEMSGHVYWWEETPNLCVFEETVSSLKNVLCLGSVTIKL